MSRIKSHARKWAAVESVCALALLALPLTFAPTPAQAATPQRIISLSPSATEILFAIGAGRQVIAVDDDSDYPANAPHSSLSSFTPNVEAIAALQPDLVVLQSSATKAAAVESGLKKLKINVYLENTPNDITGAYAEYTDLGALTGHPSRTKVLIATMKSQIGSILSRVKHSTSLSIYHELDNTLYTATSNTFIGRVYKDFGFTNIADAADTADSGGYPQLTSEYVVAANPSVIFLDDGAYGESAASVAARPGWSGLSAVTNKHVIVLPQDIADRWGPRLVDLYKFIASSTANLAGSK